MDLLPEFCRKRVLILGCGNILLGDDGFGPNVVEYLTRHYDLPDDVCAMDAGTGVRNILFTLSLSEARPEEVLIIDAVDRGEAPGRILELPIAEIPLPNLDNFSMHQAPSSNLLRELQDRCGVKVTVLVCDVGAVSPTVQPGLSETTQKAVPVVCQKIVEKLEVSKMPKVESELTLGTFHFPL